LLQLHLMKKGKITPNGVVLHTHENATAVFLTEQGFDVELIPPVQRKGARTPDIKMLGLDWEMKSPRSNGKYTIEHSFRSALKQSPNIIFDIRGSKMPQQKCITEIDRRFRDFKKVDRVMIITKQHKLLDLNK
jgi:Contact-dependent growth inhibition CdiA C-terminal domain